MGVLQYFLIALALAADAFSVSVSGGAGLKKPSMQNILLVAGYFGFFQFLMPIIGWYGGVAFEQYIKNYGPWFAFVLLTFIGGKMIWEFFQKDESVPFSLTHRALCILAIATSIDALGVGLSQAVIGQPILTLSFIVGIVTFFLCALGMHLGGLFRKVLGNKAEFIGGTILILIGIHILIEHGVFL